jgi:integrase
METKKEREPIRLTKANVEALVPEQVAYFLPVVNARGQAIQGLNVRVLPSGLKAWVHRFRFHGMQKAITLGRWPAMTCEAAEKASKAAQVGINAGSNPNQIKADEKAKLKAAVTVADLADRFILEHIGAKVVMDGKRIAQLELIRDSNGKPMGNKQSTAWEHVRLIHRTILPALGKIPVKDIGTGDLSAFLAKIRKATPTQSNRVRAVLSKMFAEAEIYEYRPSGSNPVKGQKRAQENKKERNLSDLEIVAVGAALRAAEETTCKPYFKRKEGEAKPESFYALAALRLALLAGMRKAEIIGDRYRGMPALTWADVDLPAGVLSVHHKTETKTGKKRIVHLCTAARQLLDTLPHQLGNPHVIPGDVPGQALVNLQAVWDRLRDLATTRARIEAQESGQAPAVDISDVTIHDLRRTFASVGARLGYPELWLGALLGHSASTVTQGYARVDGDPLKVAVEAIGGRIAGLLSGEIDPTKEDPDNRQPAEANAKA